MAAAAETAGTNAPAGSAFAITPDDANDLASVTRGIYVGVGGNVKVDLRGSSAIVFVAAAAGSILPVRATRVYSTGTTASSLVALY